MMDWPSSLDLSCAAAVRAVATSGLFRAARFLLAFDVHRVPWSSPLPLERLHLKIGFAHREGTGAWHLAAMAVGSMSSHRVPWGSPLPLDRLSAQGFSCTSRSASPIARGAWHLAAMAVGSMSSITAPALADPRLRGGRQSDNGRSRRGADPRAPQNGVGLF